MPDIKPGLEYSGKIVAGQDPSLKGRYKVHIPELMPHLAESAGWWCKNQAHNWRLTKSEIGVYGQYFPLQVGTSVIVKFYQEDESSGYIDRIISDNEENSDLAPPDFTSAKGNPGDRDEQYVIFKTPKNNNSFYVNEGSSESPNTIYLSFNGKRTLIKVDESGLQIFSEDDLTIQGLGNINITSSGTTNVYSSGPINVDSGSTINLNSGIFGGLPVDKT